SSGLRPPSITATGAGLRTAPSIRRLTTAPWPSFAEPRPAGRSEVVRELEAPPRCLLRGLLLARLAHVHGVGRSGLLGALLPVHLGRVLLGTGLVSAVPFRARRRAATTGRQRHRDGTRRLFGHRPPFSLPRRGFGPGAPRS